MFLWCQWSVESSYMAGDHSFPRHGWSSEMWHSTSTMLLNFHTLLTAISSGASTALMLCTLGCPGLFTCMFELMKCCMILCYEIVVSEVFSPPALGSYWMLSWFISPIYKVNEDLAFGSENDYLLNVWDWTWVENKMIKCMWNKLQSSISKVWKMIEYLLWISCWRNMETIVFLTLCHILLL